MKAKTKFTKLWSILLALAMVVGMLPIAALAAGSATETADFVSTPTKALALLNDAKTGTTASTWDGSTLTLNGVNFETTAATAVKLPDGATIIQNGENIIKGGNTDSGDCFGIAGVGSLSISGSGSLTVTGGNANRFSFGIRAESDVTIKGGAIDATGGTAGSQSFGIYTLNGDLTIEGGNVKANGGDAKESCGLWAANNSLVISGGKVVAIGGNVSGTSSGIFAMNVVIKNTDNRTPDVTTRGGEARYSRGIYIVNDGSLTISGGSLIADSYYPLSERPAALPVAYSWRTSSGDDFTVSADTAYNWSSYHDYVEIRDNTAAYTVSFDANGGTGTMADVTGVLGEYTLPANGFTAPEGKQFKGWSVNGTEKAAGATITVTENTTLKAVWEYIEYTLTVTDGTASSATATMGTTVTLTANADPTGKVFDKWVVESGSITLADANSATTTFTMPAEAVRVTATYKTIYALAVIYGTASPSGAQAAGTSVTITANAASSGQVFDKWVVESGNVTLADATSATTTFTMPAGDVSVKATYHTHSYGSEWKSNADKHWHECACGDNSAEAAHTAGDWIIDTPATATTDGTKHKACTACGYVMETGTIPATGYTVSFDANGGSGTMSDVTGVLGTYTLPENGFTAPEGQQFKCWSIDGTEKAVGDKITVTADTTVKAVWENIPVTTYTVSFDANGGSGTMAAVTGVLGDYTLPANGFTAPEGKQFKGWSVGDTEKAVGDKITVTADTTVKAVWENIPAAPTEYNILDGANSKWTQDSDGNLSVRGSGEFSKFVGVKVDGVLIDAKNYTVKEGSTIVTLNADYMNNLTVGSHTLEIVWTDGSASTAFTVNAKAVVDNDTKSPQTGDNSHMALWIALLFVSAVGVLATAVLGKKKKRSAR